METQLITPEWIKTDVHSEYNINPFHTRRLHIEEASIIQHILPSIIKRGYTPLNQETSFLLSTIEAIEGYYNFLNKSEIKDFLLAHTSLISVLSEAYKEILKSFDQLVFSLSLKYENDPESDFEGLFIIIVTLADPEFSVELLDSFYENWFLDNVVGENSLFLNFSVRPYEF